MVKITHFHMWNGQLPEYIETFVSNFEPETRDFVYCAFGNEDKIINKNFPVLLSKSPFVRFKVPSIEYSSE